MDRSQLRLKFDAPLSNFENLILSILWCAVFGSDKVSTEGTNSIGSIVSYIGASSDIDLMKHVLQDRAHLGVVMDANYGLFCLVNLYSKTTFGIEVEKLIYKIRELTVLPL